MGFLAFLLLGLLAGAIAKLILPGKQGGGWLLAIGRSLIVLLIYGALTRKR